MWKTKTQVATDTLYYLYNRRPTDEEIEQYIESHPQTFARYPDTIEEAKERHAEWEQGERRRIARQRAAEIAQRLHEAQDSLDSGILAPIDNAYLEEARKHLRLARQHLGGFADTYKPEAT